MAINPNLKYPGKVTVPSSEYPYGGAQNITTPSDGTGTPWEAALVNDIFGMQQRLLSLLGLSPSGTPENAITSQYVRAMWKLMGSRSLVHNLTGDADYALTDDENYYSRIEITDTGGHLTVARNIVVDDVEREFIFTNSTNQVLTVKTTSGSGTAVAVGKSILLRNDGVDIDPAVQEDIAILKATIPDMLAIVNPQTGDTVIVQDAKHGGTFTYDAALSATNDKAVVIDGWVREFSGTVTTDWIYVTITELILINLLEDYKGVSIDEEIVLIYPLYVAYSRLYINAILTSTSTHPDGAINLWNGKVVFGIGGVGGTGGVLKGDFATNTQLGIVLQDAPNCIVENPRIDGFEGGGIKITGTSADNTITGGKITGCTGTNGVGILIDGTGVANNTIDGTDCSGNTIGVVIQDGVHNNLENVTANGCITAGIEMLNANLNVISNPTTNDSTNGDGIVLNGGCENNTITAPHCLRNAGSGINLMGVETNNNISNTISSPNCSDNTEHGIYSDWSPVTAVINPTCTRNGADGINERDSYGFKTIGGFVDNNGGNGILHYSPHTLDSGVMVKANNGAYGIAVVTGSTTQTAEQNLTIGCHMQDNAGVDYARSPTVITAKAINCTGFITDNTGATTIADDETIAHGLSGIPLRINATGTWAGQIVTVDPYSINSTTFKVAIKDHDGTPGDTQLVYWEASLY